ncbi:hypothetical protein C8F04DRAFT_1071732 [Mycena alexandri]|uniref:Uncharacterized protein n=1 Tax=Mycena alexandri TaxID=1745969 RepID=A0AAD6X9H3_9AGAR|nr:hypothetical protein C8F04DRAFT_1071732 [Mycena alexandri]
MSGGEKPLTSDYLHSQGGFRVLELREIIATHHSVAFAKPSHGPQTVNTAIACIVKEEVKVNWNIVLGEAEDDELPALEKLIRSYLREEKIIRPLGIVSPPSSAPNTPSKSGLVADGIKPKSLEPSDHSDHSDDMDVDSQNQDPNKKRALQFDSGDESYEDWHGISPLEIDPGSAFYYALEKASIDKNWVVTVLVKDCTTDEGNQMTQFAPELKVPLHVYGPDGLNNCLFAYSKDVVAELQRCGQCPTSPWDIFWALSGYPWVIGPFGRRHDDEDEVELDSSQVIFREIPVTGSEDALRLMVVFKHPKDRNRGVPGLAISIEETDPTHVNNIKPHSDSDSDDTIKSEEQDDEERKADIANAKVSEATQLRNADKVEWLIKFLTPHNEVLRDLRAHKRQVKAKQPVPKLVSWIDEIADLHERWHVLSMDGTPTHIRGARVSDENWSKVMLRSTGYIKKCLEAHKYLKSCRDEWDVEQYLQDAGQKAGLKTLTESISRKAWNKIYKRPL